MTTTQERKMAFAHENLVAGRSIYFATTYRVLQVTPASARACDDAGAPAIKIDETGALVTIEGYAKGKPRYVSVDYAKMSAR